MTPTGTSRTTSNGADPYREPEEPEGRCPVCRGAGWLSRRAPVGHPDFGDVFPCRCQEDETNLNRLQLLERYSGLPKKRLDRMTFDSFNRTVTGATGPQRATLRAAYTAAASFGASPEGWLLLTGNHGVGKTHLAVAVVAERIKRRGAAFFAFVPDLLDHLRAAFSPNSPVGYSQLFDQVKEAPLLILDDLGAESATPWAQEKLYQIVVHRHNSELPTLITTNLAMDDIEKLQPRMASRLKDSTVVNWVAMAAPDYRDAGKRRGA